MFTNFGQPINLTRTWEVAEAKSEGRAETDICPYKGLEYFDCNGEDPKYFYGREKLTDQLLDKLRQSNFLALLGASGSGKSSVLRAGLLHQLQLGQRLAGSEAWQIQILSPGKHPLESLTLSFLDKNLSAIARASQLDQVESLLQKGAEGLRKLVQASDSQRVVLVIDQFEELFTLCENQQERDDFCSCLLGTLSQIPEKLCVILAMRIDFFGKCFEHQYSGLGKKIEANVVAVPLMQLEELRQVVTKPAQKVNLAVEEELVEQILRDVQGSPGSLPLVQYSLTQLWQGREHNCLQLSKYVQLGGIGGALDKRATEVYGQLTKVEQEVAKHIFLNLTRLGEGTEDTRRRVFQQDLVTAKYSQALVDKVIKTLADEKLVVTGEQVAKGLEMKREAVLDVPHEALIRNWRLLKEWLDNSRFFLLKQREIEGAASKWREQGYEVDYLLQGIRLWEAQEFQHKQRELYPLSKIASDFLGKSFRYQKNRLFRTLGLVSSFFIIPLLGTFISGYLTVREQQLTEYKQIIRECKGQSVCQGRLEALEKLIKANINLQNSDLNSAILRNADLRGGNLRNANLRDTDLRGVNLKNADLRGADLRDAILRDENLRSDISSSTRELRDIFTGSTRSTNLRGADLRNANLSNTDLRNANLNGDEYAGEYGAFIFQLGTNLSEANLRGANLSSANLYLAGLIHTDLRGATLRNADLKDAYLIGADLRDANLQEANFRGTNLQEANFWGTNLQEAKHLTSSQIKSTCNWEKALYQGKLDGPKNEWVLDQKTNQAYIEQLKQDKASDPSETVDCSRWK